MFGKIAGGIATILVGSALGLGSFWLAVNADTVGVKNGPWRTTLAAGSIDAGPYLRARIALQALLALNSTQAVYFIAERDSDGQALDGRCRYKVSGHDLPARWWSLTAYGADYFLVGDLQKRYSLTKSAAAGERDGNWSVAVASGPAADIAAPAAGPFSLMVRLYNPNAEIYQTLGTIAMPSIVREGC